MSSQDFNLPSFQFEIEEEAYDKAIIKVIGVGGGGGNAVSHMLQKGMEGVEFCSANTDVQALSKIETIYRGIRNNAPELPYLGIKLGQETTRGLGAGARPDIGQKAVQESIDDIKAYLEGSDMVFITAGMGGGTGTGGASVIASLAKQMGILTVGVVTKPFTFEGKPRSRNAEQGIKALAEHVDSLIIIPNEKLIQAMGKNTSLMQCFEQANDVLYNAVHGISDLITRPGMINVDFADVKTVMSSMGMTMMGTGVAEGEDRAMEATRKAINSPLLEHVDIKGAKGILVNIIADDSLSIGEFHEVGSQIREYADQDANIVIGSSLDTEMKERMMVTLVATGVESSYNENKNQSVNTDYRDEAPAQQNVRSEQETINATEHLKKHVSPQATDENFDDSGISGPRVVRQGPLSEEERRQAYNDMKESKKKRGGLFGRKTPDLSSQPEERPQHQEPAPRSQETRYSEPARESYREPSLSGISAPVDDRPAQREPEARPTGIQRFLSKKG
jgi:cell division protein FtsZ